MSYCTLKQNDRPVCNRNTGDLRGFLAFPTPQTITEATLKSESLIKALFTNAYDDQMFVGLPQRVTRTTDNTTEALFTDSNVSNPTKVKGSVPNYTFEMENLPLSYKNNLMSFDNQQVNLIMITSKNYVIGRGDFAGDIKTFPARIYVDYMPAVGEETASKTIVTVQAIEDENFTNILDISQSNGADYTLLDIEGLPQVTVEFVSAVSGASGTALFNYSNFLSPSSEFASGTFATGADWNFKDTTSGTITVPTTVADTTGQLAFDFTTLATGTYNVYRKDAANVTDLVLMYEGEAVEITVT